jgi:hypothetical protein
MYSCNCFFVHDITSPSAFSVYISALPYAPSTDFIKGHVEQRNDSPLSILQLNMRTGT